MTTLRDYILDCRCPNCGTAMERKPPRRASFRTTLTPFLVWLSMILAAVAALVGDYDRAAWMTSVAVFLVVTDR